MLSATPKLRNDEDGRGPVILEPFQRAPMIPLHHQIKEDLSLQLRAGRWLPGAELPGEDSLCQHYGVSRGTIGRALKELEREGVIERFQGRGSFLSEPKLEGSIAGSYRRFRIEGPPLDAGARLLLCARRPARAQVARILALATGAPVYQLERVRYARGVPVTIQSSFISAASCPDLPKHDLHHRHLIDILQQEFGVRLTRAEEFIEPALADAYAARHLNLKRGTPVFQIERITYRLDGRVGEYRRAAIRGDIYRYRLELR